MYLFIMKIEILKEKTLIKEIQHFKLHFFCGLEYAYMLCVVNCKINIYFIHSEPVTVTEAGLSSDPVQYLQLSSLTGL